MLLENIRIVLVGTTHPGNIGATARAMKTMCFNRLVLVDPQCPIGEVAYARASGANSILDQRETHAGLDQAIAGCQLVVATSARRRSLPWPELEPPAAGKKILALGDAEQIALVFGREHSGLRNEEIQLCNSMVSIPTSPDFGSLNLASAVQVICYEIYRQTFTARSPKPLDELDEPATSAEVEGYFAHLESVLHAIGYLRPEQPGMIMPRLRRLYLRNELSRNEINILRGILSAIEKDRR